jgi:hypothetical protein
MRISWEAKTVRAERAHLSQLGSAATRALPTASASDDLPPLGYVLAEHLRAALRDVLVREMRLVQRLEAIEKRLPPTIGDLNHPALQHFSKATLRRMIKDGRLKRVGGKPGGRVLVDLNSIQPPDDETVAQLARAAREGA